MAQIFKRREIFSLPSLAILDPWSYSSCPGFATLFVFVLGLNSQKTKVGVTFAFVF
jgi:hypothetical protein